VKGTRNVTIVAGLLLIACLAASVVALRQIDRLRTVTSAQEALYIPSPKALKRLSLGYDGLLADIYWTRTVQYFGTMHHAGAQQFPLLGPLLEITTALDPHLTVAYEFGANFLAPKPPNGAGMPERAVELAEYGIRNNPDDWHIYYNLGFIDYMELKNYRDAADAFARGSRVPNAHPFLRVMAAQMAQHGGESEMARLMWATTYQTTGDNAVRANAAAHLRALQVDDDISNLQRLVSVYREKTGHSPAGFSEMQAAGLLQEIPVDPLGNPYLLNPDGHIEVRDPDSLPFIEKGMPPGYIAPSRPKFLPSD
jgi:tetratricopeptide (TPR) repeat protein